VLEPVQVRQQLVQEQEPQQLALEQRQPEMAKQLLVQEPQQKQEPGLRQLQSLVVLLQSRGFVLQQC
jgi:hypothetical protein